jgi:hypothetical protein
MRNEGQITDCLNVGFCSLLVQSTQQLTLVKLNPCSFLALALVPSALFAGDDKNVVVENPDLFLNARRPVTNPVLNDLAIPRTKIHPVMIHQTMPSTIDTVLGQLPVGGDFQLYAVQAEWAVTPRLSLLANKDGYLVFDPSNTLTKTSGWANLGVGAKYAFLYKPEKGVAASLQLAYEIPSGDTDVWQGTGDGQVVPTLFFLKSTRAWQFQNALGARLPVDDSDSAFLYDSIHLGYHLTPWFYPLMELNWMHVTNAGEGESRFGAQAGGAVPAIANFEAGDLVNWGAANGDVFNDLVTLGLGFRINCPKMDNVDFGAAWEFPLTDDNATILEDRLTFDVEIAF